MASSEHKKATSLATGLIIAGVLTGASADGVFAETHKVEISNVNSDGLVEEVKEVNEICITLNGKILSHTVKEIGVGNQISEQVEDYDKYLTVDDVNYELVSVSVLVDGDDTILEKCYTLRSSGDVKNSQSLVFGVSQMLGVVGLSALSRK